LSALTLSLTPLGVTSTLTGISGVVTGPFALVFLLPHLAPGSLTFNHTHPFGPSLEMRSVAIIGSAISVSESTVAIALALIEVPRGAIVNSCHELIRLGLQ